MDIIQKYDSSWTYYILLFNHPDHDRWFSALKSADKEFPPYLIAVWISRLARDSASNQYELHDILMLHPQNQILGCPSIVLRDPFF